MLSIKDVGMAAVRDGMVKIITKMLSISCYYRLKYLNLIK